MVVTVGFEGTSRIFGLILGGFRIFSVGLKGVAAFFREFPGPLEGVSKIFQNDAGRVNQKEMTPTPTVVLLKPFGNRLET